MQTRQTLRLRLGASHNDREAAFPLPQAWDARVFPHRGGRELTPRAIDRAFAEPVGAPPLRAAARGARRAVILVDDFRRPTPAEPLCLKVIDELMAAGLEREGLSIVLGNGAHRVMNGREVRRRLGAAVERVGQVVSHDAFSPEVVFMGVTAAGTPVLVNRVAAEADFSVSISTVYPHVLTAWGGGAKMVLPGICHVASSHYHHTRLSAGTWGGAPRESPARRDLEEATELFGLHASVCCIVNDHKQLCGLRIGDPTQAHRSAVRRARRVYETDLAGFSPDLVLANAYPMDGDPTQTSKTEIPGKRCGDVPILMIIDFADPCPWHGVYHGPRRPFLRRPRPSLPERSPELLVRARVFVFCPQVGKGYVPTDRSWYCDHDWDRLLAAMRKRFPRAKVAVLPSAPLQMPVNVGGAASGSDRGRKAPRRG